MNAVEIEEAVSRLAEQPFDPEEFPFAFLEALGNKTTTIKRLRSGASNKSDLGGVLQTNNIHIATAVIYSNGTESNLLLRSLQRALYKDDASRRVSESDAGPLFAGESDDGDLASGTIYVLRSKSEHPTVAANREVLHKIGVTGGDVARRIANAKLDATFLLADVEIVATYTLYNINRTKLENLFHRIFDPARLDIEIKDRFGNPVIPREWFLVPRFVIDDAVEKIRDGTITDYVYHPTAARLGRVDKVGQPFTDRGEVEEAGEG